MKNVWKGWIIDKSLKDKKILSELKVVKSNIEENTNGEVRKVWKLYTVEIEHKEINKTSKIFEKLIKLGYYMHFTNRQGLLIIFSGKKFRIRLVRVGKGDKNGITYFKILHEDKKVWGEASEYGTKVVNVDPRYFIKIE